MKRKVKRNMSEVIPLHGGRGGDTPTVDQLVRYFKEHRDQWLDVREAMEGPCTVCDGNPDHAVVPLPKGGFTVGPCHLCHPDEYAAFIGAKGEEDGQKGSE